MAKSDDVQPYTGQKYDPKVYEFRIDPYGGRHLVKKKKLDTDYAAARKTAAAEDAKSPSIGSRIDKALGITTNPLLRKDPTRPKYYGPFKDDKTVATPEKRARPATQAKPKTMVKTATVSKRTYGFPSAPSGSSVADDRTGYTTSRSYQRNPNIGASSAIFGKRKDNLSHQGARHDFKGLKFFRGKD